jgi:hypothetical protein
MGLLDDAIREHLDLKRRRGADPADVERAEREALGPVRRTPTEPGEAEAEFAPAIDHEDGYAAAEYFEAAVELVDDSDWHDPFAQEATGVSEVHDPLLFESPAPPMAETPAAERRAEAPAQAPVAPPAQEPLAPMPPPPAAQQPPAPPPPAASEPIAPVRAPAGEPDAPAPGEPASDRAGDETVEYDVEDALESEPGTEDEDVLEETPEFLQDTPDHDRLWFEQKPPRDFDFDG